MSMEPPQGTGVESSNQPDYSAVNVPSKPPTEYSYVERRAELLQQVIDLGHPDAINQTEVSERYDVSQQQISRDLDRLAEYIEESLGERRDLVTEAVYKRAVRELFEQDEPYKAWKVTREWNEWLVERKDLKELAEKVDALENQHK